MQNKNSFFKKNQKFFTGTMWNNFKILVFVLSLGSFLAYLLMVNNANTMGIAIGEMQYQIKVLQDQNRDLQNEASSLKAMARIKDISLNQLSMVPAGAYQYLNVETETIAFKK